MIKIGIVGTGGIADWHVTEFQKNKYSTVVAACDVSSERLNAFCDKFNIKERYNNVEALLDKADIDEVGKKIFELVISTASGRPTKSEFNGYADEEFTPWQVGVVMYIFFIKNFILYSTNETK